MVAALAVINEVWEKFTEVIEVIVSFINYSMFIAIATCIYQ